MAADILAYHATRVPVGDDQRQHLELANDIAQKFNHDYGVDFFPAVEPLILPEAARVMSLRDGTRKMSKSDPSDQSRINLTDDADTIALKIRRARTDPEPLPSEAAGLEGRPEARNLVAIMAALAGATLDAVLARAWRRGFGAFKDALAELVVATVAPIAGETRGCWAIRRTWTPCCAMGRRGPGDRRADRARSGADRGVSGLTPERARHTPAAPGSDRRAEGQGRCPWTPPKARLWKPLVKSGFSRLRLERVQGGALALRPRPVKARHP